MNYGNKINNKLVQKTKAGMISQSFKKATGK